MTKEQRINKYIRQSDIIDLEKLKKGSITMVGVGSVGSFAALSLAKMGVGNMKAFDEDGVQKHNLPAQFFTHLDASLKSFKVDALCWMLEQYSDVKYIGSNRNYKNQKLLETVVVSTDNMHSRRLVWNQFLKQKQCKYLIEARMGAELAKLYTITDKSKKTQRFYEATLHSDAESVQLPCTARSIIYNVLMISSLIARAYKAIIQKEDFPKELIFNMTRIDQFSLMLRSK